MIDTKTPDGPLRYRLYYRLMDVCLIATIVGMMDLLIYYFFGVEDFGLPLPRLLDIGFSIFLVAFGIVGPFVLFPAKLMRDDYAEQLWRRSVVILAYGVGLVPLALFIAFNSALAILGPEGTAELFPAWLGTEWEVVKTIYVTGWIYVLLFVLMFQFLRWSDSR